MGQSLLVSESQVDEENSKVNVRSKLKVNIKVNFGYFLFIYFIYLLSIHCITKQSI